MFFLVSVANKTMTKKAVIPEAIPTLEMPKKSHATETVSRPCRSVVKEIVLQNHTCYVNLSDVVRRIENLKSLSAWKTNVSETNIISNKFSTEYNSKIPEFTVAIDDGLGYTIKVYDWYIPEDHSIYSIYHRSMKNVIVSNLVHTLVSYFKCPGITYITNDTNIYCHVIP